MKITFSLSAVVFLFAVACTSKQDGQVTAMFDASVQGIGGDCKLPLLDFGSRTTEIDKLTGSTNPTKLYYAVNLNPAYSKAGTSLQVVIRKTAASEERACTTMGPAYPSITVTSAMAK